MGYDIFLSFDEPWSGDELMQKIAALEGAEVHVEGGVAFVRDDDLRWERVSGNELVNSVRRHEGVGATLMVNVREHGGNSRNELMRVSAALLQQGHGDVTLMDHHSFPFLVRARGKIWLNINPDMWPPNGKFPDLPAEAVRVSLGLRDPRPWKTAVNR